MTPQLSGSHQKTYDAVFRHPDTKEAGYARSQGQNIINAAVPDQELLEAQVALAVERFAKDGLVQRDEGSFNANAFRAKPSGEGAGRSRSERDITEAIGASCERLHTHERRHEWNN